MNCIYGLHIHNNYDIAKKYLYRNHMVMFLVSLATMPLACRRVKIN